MNSRRRVSAALLGLLALVVGVWFGQGVGSAAAQVWRLIQNVAVDPDR